MLPPKDRGLEVGGGSAHHARVPGRINPEVSGLVLRGLLAHAPELVDEAAANALLAVDDPAGVPLEAYRSIIDRVVQAGRGDALLAAGSALRSLQHPLLFVLLNSDHPALVVEKELRLSRFIHSRHAVRIVESRPNHITLQHHSTEDAPPHASEHLAACGQHLTLFEEIGCRQVRLRFPASAAPEHEAYAAGAFAPLPGGDGFHMWRFDWARLEPTRRPMEGLDDLLLGSQPLAQLEERPGPSRDVERIIRRDLGRTWRVAEVAAALETSARSLQRSLSEAGTRFSDVVDRVRNEEAARLLSSGALSVTEVGYVCGFADSAHFSRSFKRRHGLPPSEYRPRRAPPSP